MITTATTTNGTLRGSEEDGLVVFRGVPYATCARFQPPSAPLAWSGERDAVSDGPIAPQQPGRLERVIGTPEPHEQSEECLTLTITTPGADDQGRAVLVWIHGGAWVSGAGSWRCYGGQRLASEGDVVVVAVNYRLGALGYLRAPGVCEGNLGLADQVAALRWVRENIAAFGGNPDMVTVAGQSAGAHAVQCLLGAPAAEGLFLRAIVQSSPAGLGLGSERVARRSGRRFLTRLRTDPHDAAPADILAAQNPAGSALLRLAPQWKPAAGVDPLPDPAGWAACLARRAPGLEVIVGTNAREMSAFLVQNPALRRFPFIGTATMDAAERRLGDFVFHRPALRLADRLADAGARVWAYRFDYAPPGSPFGATHCMELPFLFGSAADWAAAPMLAGADPLDVERLGKRLRAAWLGFVRDGAPAVDESWQQYIADTSAVHVWNV
jgi:para-nitrobenzyl esterase